MNLKEQEYICTLAQFGSITKAAKQLFITQPALSSYISGVERSLGVELFDRRGKIYSSPTQESFMWKKRDGCSP